MLHSDKKAQECDATEASWIDEPLVHKKPAFAKATAGK